MRLRRGWTLVELAVAIAVGCWLFVAVDRQMDQQRAMVRLMDAKLAARLAAAQAARQILADPAAVAGLTERGLPGFTIGVSRLGSAGAPGVSYVRIVARARPPAAPAWDEVEVVVRD